MSEGKKYDTGKAPWHLLRKGCVLALEGVIQVLGFGAAKYGEENWKLVDNAVVRYRDALDRHLAEIDKGNVLDAETGLPHIYHVATNALFMAHFEAEHQLAAPNGVRVGPLKSLVSIRATDSRLDGTWQVYKVLRVSPAPPSWIPRDTLVEIRVNMGENQRGRADKWDWSRDKYNASDCGDITHYRVLK